MESFVFFFISLLRFLLVHRIHVGAFLSSICSSCKMAVKWSEGQKNMPKLRGFRFLPFGYKTLEFSLPGRQFSLPGREFSLPGTQFSLPRKVLFYYY